MTTFRSHGTWYAARLSFRSQVGEALDIDPLCEERVVLFFAFDQTRANDAALRYGRAQEHGYLNQNGAWVAWRFVGVEALDEVGAEQAEEGGEVFSRYFRPSDLTHAEAVEGRLSRDGGGNEHDPTV